MEHLGQHDQLITCTLWMQDEDVPDDPFSTSSLRPAPDDVTPHDPGGTTHTNQAVLPASLASDVRALCVQCTLTRASPRLPQPSGQPSTFTFAVAPQNPPVDRCGIDANHHSIHPHVITQDGRGPATPTPVFLPHRINWQQQATSAVA